MFAFQLVVAILALFGLGVLLVRGFKFLEEYTALKKSGAVIEYKLYIDHDKKKS